jgi:hypothetical protein
MPHNAEWGKTQGEVVILDNDDSMLPHALRCLLDHWVAIPSSDHAGFSGVTAR